MNKIGFKPLAKRILVQQIFEEKEPTEKTAFGLEIVSGVEDIERVLDAKGDVNLTKVPTNRVKVIRVGKDVEEVKEGEIGIFDSRGTRITYKGEKYIVLEENNILGIEE